MRHLFLPHVGFAATLTLSGCITPAAAKSAPARGAFSSYASADGSLMRSTLVIDDQRDGQHLAGVTQFDDGSCLSEEATTDRAGRLVRAEYTVSRPASDAHVVLDPQAGFVEVTLPTFQAHWSVPNDLSWVWAPQLYPAVGGETLATPLSAVVIDRSAHADRAIRALDLGTFESASVMSDQLVVIDDEHSETVVVGDEAVEVHDGLPRKWHAGLIDRDIEARDMDGLLAMLAAFNCGPAERSKT
ncbi:MAG TPA: hypothetical protein VGI70_18640 [Polyangiales bacterium]|jgi:hypothetical protein